MSDRRRFPVPDFARSGPGRPASLRNGIAVLCLSGLVGCGGGTFEPAVGPGATPASTQDSATSTVAMLRDDWFSIRMGGSPCGRQHDIRTEERAKGQPARVACRSEILLRIRRGADTVEVRQSVRWHETAAGDLLDFAAEMQAGPGTERFSGERRGGELVVRFEHANGQRRENVVPWPAGAGGFSAVEKAAADRTLVAGERFAVEHLEWLGPNVGFVRTEWTVGELETVDVDGTAETLRRVEQTQKLHPAGTQLGTLILWLDDAKRIRLARNPNLDQTIVRTTQAGALRTDGPLPDLFALTLVRLDGTLERPWDRSTAEYLAEFNGPATLPFADGTFQRTTPAGPNAFRLAVRNAATAEPFPDGPAADTPTELDRAAGRWIELDHPAVVKLAASVPTGANASETAGNLTKAVHAHMTLKNFSQALGSAGEAAETRTGDCTEHAFLLTALARKHGLPARAVVGLVQVERPEPGFLYHLWTEIHCDGRWLPWDGTTGRPTHVGYLRIAAHSLTGDDPLSVFLPVQNLVGRFRLKLLETK